MRVLPGAVDVGVPEGDGSKAVLPGVELEILFTHPLGDAVGADRIGRGGLRRRLGDVPVEHPARGGEDNPLTAAGDGCVEDVDQTDAVDLGVKPRLADRAAHRHLGCLMADGIGPFGGKHPSHRGGVADIDLVQRHARRQVIGRAAGEVIEHGNCMAGGQQGVRNVAADEAGTASDQGFHGNLSCWTDPQSNRVRPFAMLRMRPLRVSFIADEGRGMLPQVLGATEQPRIASKFFGSCDSILVMLGR